VRCALPWVLRPPSPQSTLLFLLPLGKILGLGITALITMMTFKRSPIEDLMFALSPLWCLMPKGEKRKFYLFMSSLRVS
jgi:hypothetical protein